MCSGTLAPLHDNKTNTRFRTIEFKDYNGSSWNIYLEIEDGQGGILVRTGSANWTSQTTFSFSLSGPTRTGGGTVSLSGTGNATVDANNYVTGYSNSASGTLMNLPALQCNLNNNGTATKYAGPGATASEPNVAPSNQVTSDTTTLNQVVTTFTNSLGARIQGALGGNTGGLKSLTRNGGMMEAQIGLSAGDGFNPVLIGVWGSFSYTEFDNDFSRTKYDGSRYMFMGGADFSPSEDTVVGIALGYEDTSLDTDFNGGEADADGFTIAPYLGMTIDDTWSMDLSAGYSNIDTDQYRVFGGTRITSDVDTERYFISGNINGFTQRGDWLLSGRAGGLHAISIDDDFTESDGTAIARRKIKLTQLILGGEAAYSMGDYEPFVGATYAYDLHATDLTLTPGKQPHKDRYDVLLTGGLRFYNKSGMSGSVEASKRIGRTDYDEVSIGISVRWDL